MRDFELGVQMEPEPELLGPDPLMEMVAKARPVCRKPRGHEAEARRALLAEVRAEVEGLVVDADESEEVIERAAVLAILDHAEGETR